jgi:hypothetical protein
MAETKEINLHLDILGRSLAVGDCVACPDGNSLSVATVVKLTAKMVKVRRVGGKYYDTNKYSKDLVKLDGPEVSFYILKNNS